MPHAIWKLTALAVVVGVGAMVVVQAQRGFNQHHEENQADDPQVAAPAEAPDDPETPGGIESPPSQSEPELSLDSFADDAGVPVPAETKIGGSRPAKLRPVPDARPVDLASQSINDDPFAETLSEPPPRKTPAIRSPRADTARAEPALKLNPLDESESVGDRADPAAESADAQSGPRLLSDRATRGTRPVEEPSSDPFAEDDVAKEDPKAIDAAGATEPDAPDSDATEPDLDMEEIGVPAKRPAASPKTSAPIADEKTAAPDESDLPAGESPIIERAAPRRKTATPAVPKVDEESVEVPDELLPAEVPPTKRDSVPNDLKDSKESPPSAKPAEEDRLPEAKAKETEPDELLADPFDMALEPKSDEAAPRRDKDDPPQRTAPTERESAPNEDAESLPSAGPKSNPVDRPILEEPHELPAEAKQTLPPPATPPGALTLPPADSPIEPLNETDSAPSAKGSAVPRPAPRRAARPQLTIEKNAPATAILGQPMVYHIVVRNVGTLAARDVVVDEAIPEGAKIDGSIPQALLQEKRLFWKLGTLEPGGEKKISVRVIPQAEGTLGSVATVNFAPEGAETANVAGPRLQVEVSAPEQAIVGTPIPFKFHVANVGSIDAGEVVIRDVLPAALRHPDGNDLEYVVGPLAVGKSRDVELTLTAAQTGKTVNRVIVTADGRVTEETSVALEVVGPTLQLARKGTRRLFPGKTGHYTNTVTNPGGAALTGVRIVENVPPGMEFVSATDGGQFDTTRRTVTWTIERLEPRESRSVQVTLKSNARGSQISVVRADDASGGSGETVGTTNVAGVPALSIELGELPALVGVGEQIKVPVRILNRGSDLATNVEARVILPEGLELVTAKAAVEYKVAPAGAANEAAGETAGTGKGASFGQEVRFSPVARLDSRGDTTIELTVKALRPGSARIQVQAQCDQVTEPVRREEVTTVATIEE
jgi:uncharacterized repeat protein (TIGR01451 family)